MVQSQMLTIADGGGVQEPVILADEICEQPLRIATRSHIERKMNQHKQRKEVLASG